MTNGKVRRCEIVDFFRELRGEHPYFVNISVGAKHSGSKSLLFTHKLSVVRREPLHNWDARVKGGDAPYD
jgi:hypothetical protein